VVITRIGRRRRFTGGNTGSTSPTALQKQPYRPRHHPHHLRHQLTSGTNTPSAIPAHLGRRRHTGIDYHVRRGSNQHTIFGTKPFSPTPPGLRIGYYRRACSQTEREAASIYGRPQHTVSGLRLTPLSYIYADPVHRFALQASSEVLFHWYLFVPLNELCFGTSTCCQLGPSHWSRLRIPIVRQYNLITGSLLTPWRS